MAGSEYGYEDYRHLLRGHTFSGGGRRLDQPKREEQKQHVERLPLHQRRRVAEQCAEALELHAHRS